MKENDKKTVPETSHFGRHPSVARLMKVKEKKIVSKNKSDIVTSKDVGCVHKLCSNSMIIETFVRHESNTITRQLTVLSFRSIHQFNSQKMTFGSSTDRHVI